MIPQLLLVAAWTPLLTCPLVWQQQMMGADRFVVGDVYTVYTARG